MADDIIETAKAVFRAFETKDRAAIEGLIAQDFKFFSPLDNGLDRATYFERCWPNSELVQRFEFLHTATDGYRAIVTYEATNIDGHGYRNTEILTIEGGQVTEVEVYFGWSVPHEADPGEWIDDDEEWLDEDDE